jgi:hypothetical protein
MRDLVIQGMRRTGTTVLFDVFVRDPRFATYYEPLNHVPESASPGGGSGLHPVDLFGAVRDARADFLASLATPVDEEVLNHGGPARPDVEVDHRVPEPVASYLDHVLGRPGPKVIKFVRMGAKLRFLADRAPGCVLAFPVRDPRAVVRSYLLGRSGRTANRYPTADDVFERSSAHDPWSVRRLSDALAARDGLAPDPGFTDAERVVLVWADAVRTMESAGRDLFGDRFVRVRHEDFCADPRGMLGSLYDRLEGTPDAATVDWCEQVVRAPREWALHDDSRWERVFARAGASELVSTLGYG